MKYHFYERLEREKDYYLEYKKLEAICAERYSPSGFDYDAVSINSWIDSHFRKWKRRSNFCSFSELRNHLGFPSNYTKIGYGLNSQNVDLNRYVLFCEMILNPIDELRFYRTPILDGVIEDFKGTVLATIAKAGLELKKVDDSLIILEKNAVALAVAESAPKLSDAVIGYNHYLLRGDIEKKNYY